MKNVNTIQINLIFTSQIIKDSYIWDNRFWLFILPQVEFEVQTEALCDPPDSQLHTVTSLAVSSDRTKTDNRKENQNYSQWQ